jgi:phosphoglycerate dehydrogenase-like enzyme
MTDDRPLVVLDARPHGRDRIFTPDALQRLHDRFDVVDLEDEPAGVGSTELLPDAFAVVGQPDLPAERLARAGRLRAIVNVEGNFFPNVDYPRAFAQGVRVLSSGTAVRRCRRGVRAGPRARPGPRHQPGGPRLPGRHRAVRHGPYGRTRPAAARRRRPGRLRQPGRALHRLLDAFRPTIRVHDPWLPASVLRQQGLQPASLQDTLALSRFVFVLATVTDASRELIGAAELDLLPEGARLVLISRAAVVDYDALVERVAAGRFLAGVDVWPDEPLAADHPARLLEGMVLSPHRAGGIPQALLSIGDMVCDDLELIAAGLPPVRLQQAAPELVGRYRNRPVD